MKLKLRMHSNSNRPLTSITKQRDENLREPTTELLHFYFSVKKALYPQWRMIAREARY